MFRKESGNNLIFFVIHFYTEPVNNLRNRLSTVCERYLLLLAYFVTRRIYLRRAIFHTSIELR